jgi:hypothetical protein
MKHRKCRKIKSNIFRALTLPLIADTHIIDSFYKGAESNPEDTGF